MHRTPFYPPAPSVRCEPLEPRRLFAIEVISVAAGLAATSSGMSGETDLSGGAPEASIVSDDGRYVAFVSNGGDLVSGAAGDGTGNVYLRDRATATTRLVSARPDGLPAGESGDVGGPSLSGDGRYVAFVSESLQILPGLTRGGNVFVRDMQTGVTSLASHAAAGGMANGESFNPIISRNGRYVVFVSRATDMTADSPTFDGGAVYRYDVQSGAVQLVSDAVPSTADVVIDLPQISDDGNAVAYLAYKVPPFTDVTGDAYVKDMTTGVTTVATTNEAGQPLNGPALDLLAELSGDGHKVVFQTTAAATANDVNHTTDVFVRDLVAGTTSLVSAGPGATSIPDATGGSSGVSTFGGRSISADGRFVVFESPNNLTGSDPGSGTSLPQGHVFLRDLSTHTTRLLTPTLAVPFSVDNYFSTISADGRFAAFYSDRPDAQSTGAVSLIVQDLANGQEVVVNQMPTGLALDPGSAVNHGSAFSRSGNVIVFAMGDRDVSALVPGITDNNSTSDLLARTLPGGPLDGQAPTVAVLALPAVTTIGALFYDFDVTYIDDNAIDPATVGAGDVIVGGPGGYRQAATLLSATPAGTGSQLIARYRLVAPNGVFDGAANGAYAVEVAPGQVADASGNVLAAGPIPGATFTVNIAMPDGPDLQAASLQGFVPTSLIAGGKQKIKPLLLSVTNGGTAPAVGSVAVRVVASADGVADGNDPVVAERPNQKLKLLPGQTRVLKVKVGLIPAMADGDYRLLALVNPTGALAERLVSNNAAALPAPVHIAAPFADLGVTGPTLIGRLAPGKKATLLLTARSDGNQIARGVQPVRVRFTADPANPAAVSRTVDTTLKVNLKPGATRTLRAKFSLPADLPPGSYFIVVELLPGGSWSDTDSTDNVATSALAYTV